jgi:triacylglycerol esterase/lipase EstA (alpha/beta hydrolase family)
LVDLQLNDSLWELHAPEGHDMDIVFFHGLQFWGDFKDAVWKTWRVRGTENEIWPKKLLTKTFPTARMASVSNNSTVMRNDGQLCMYTLGEYLVSGIILANFNIGQESRPVFLVGHSVGGLIIKQLIISAIDMQGKYEITNNGSNFNKITAFLNNFKGVFYYSPPHNGSRLGDLLRRLPVISPTVERLITLDASTARLNNDFRIYRQKLRAGAMAVAEGLETVLPVMCANLHSSFKHIFDLSTMHHMNVRMLVCLFLLTD